MIDIHSIPAAQFQPHHLSKPDERNGRHQPKNGPRKPEHRNVRYPATLVDKARAQASELHCRSERFAHGKLI